MDETGQIPFWEDEENCNPPKKVSAGQRYIFRRSGMDRIWSEHCPGIEDGTPVVVTQLPSAPKPGTMGQVHISDARTGEFLGMCSMHSLSTNTDELERSGLVKMVKHNPPLNAEEDTKNRRLVGFLMRLPKVKAAEAGRMGTGEFFYEVEDTAGKVFRHKYDTHEQLVEGVGMFVKGIERENPPIEIISSEPSKTDKTKMVLHYRLTAPMNSTKDVEVVLRTLYPGWTVVSHGSLREGTYPGVCHAYGVVMKRSHKNPPLPASALMDITTAKTISREVDDGLRPMGNLGTVDHLLDRSLQKLRGSHLGQVDWSNPPEVVTAHEARSFVRRWLQATGIEDKVRIVSAKTISFQDLARGSIVQVKVAGRMMESTWFELKRDAKRFGILVHWTDEGYGTNPPASPVVEIYRDIVEIRAIKPDGKRYVHKFGRGSNIYGMSDGTILIRSRKGKRLWKNFKMEG